MVLETVCSNSVVQTLVKFKTRFKFHLNLGRRDIMVTQMSAGILHLSCRSSYCGTFTPRYHRLAAKDEKPESEAPPRSPAIVSTLGEASGGTVGKTRTQLQTDQQVPQ